MVANFENEFNNLNFQVNESDSKDIVIKDDVSMANKKNDNAMSVNSDSGNQWANSEWEHGEDYWNENAGENKAKEREKDEDLESCETFEDMGLDDNILHAIYQYGFEKPSPIQKLAVKPIIEGRDVIAQAQAGQGKTGAFTLSILQRIDPKLMKTQAIVLVPTRVLADMHLEFMRAMGSRRSVNVTRCIGGTSMREDREAIRAGAHIVLGTPGRIAGLIEDRTLSVKDLRVLVLDEADELLSDYGSDGGFREKMKWIIQHVSKDTQMAVFSATFSPAILEITDKFMVNVVNILIKPEEITMRHIKQYFIALSERWKLDTLMDLYDTISVTQSIIFVNTISKLEYLRQEMEERMFAVSCYHANLDMVERMEVLRDYKIGKSRVLIASNVLSRGIDIETVSLVINYDIPNCKEDYIHRIGRSGRASRKGVAINFVTEKDVKSLKAIEDYFLVNIEEMPINIADTIK